MRLSGLEGDARKRKPPRSSTLGERVREGPRWLLSASVMSSVIAAEKGETDGNRGSEKLIVCQAKAHNPNGLATGSKILKTDAKACRRLPLSPPSASARA